MRACAGQVKWHAARPGKKVERGLHAYTASLGHRAIKAARAAAERSERRNVSACRVALYSPIEVFPKHTPGRQVLQAFLRSLEQDGRLQVWLHAFCIVVSRVDTRAVLLLSDQHYVQLLTFSPENLEVSASG